MSGMVELLPPGQVPLAGGSPLLVVGRWRFLAELLAFVSSSGAIRRRRPPILRRLPAIFGGPLALFGPRASLGELVVDGGLDVAATSGPVALAGGGVAFFGRPLVGFVLLFPLHGRNSKDPTVVFEPGDDRAVRAT
jgi:hypothetical protein